ncbi:MAG: hypothetical protein H0U23_11415 [Blastocatellia bacterium]|nr:hypothetical protein [Blastocatellia bacterium]
MIAQVMNPQMPAIRRKAVDEESVRGMSCAWNAPARIPIFSADARLFYFNL